MSEAVQSGAVLRIPQPVLYPERGWRRPGALDKAVDAVTAAVVARFGGFSRRRLAEIAEKTGLAGAALAGLPDEALRARGQALRDRLRKGRASDDDAITSAFAVVREASDRVLGMRHFDVQVMGGYALLRGMIAEMDTGEGKTLTAALAAATAALGGMPVHVVTVNDYLARRDAGQLRPLYEFLGLSVGIVSSDLSDDEKRAAYACDITYCTNKDLAFDYLRDRLTLGRHAGNLRMKIARYNRGADGQSRLLLRGLHFAIVDEADSILIDEARTPLILSRNLDDTPDGEAFGPALDIARKLVAGEDYICRADERRVELTPAGCRRVAGLARPLGRLWQVALRREEWVLQALTAERLFHRDEHYIVRDGKVQIVDEYTGRVMGDRFWSDGLHQMIELKEGCEPSGMRVTLARMTYQKFFRRYRRLAGMSGTVSEVADELWRVYRLQVCPIPQHRPSRRQEMPAIVVKTETEKWRAIAMTAAILASRGVPLLIGTRSVASSLKASEHLSAVGVDHVILNAAQDAAEAHIVAMAGAGGRVTVATNMAGRGTDIRLADDVCARGGLHVIMSELHDSRRIDRQLAGRCARQGQPGVHRAILSADDALLDMDPLGLSRRLVRLGLSIGSPWMARQALRGAQYRAERLHSRMRRTLLDGDEVIDHALAFAGRPE